MAEREKIDLIYVASIGRSGTTLFECMLGAHPQIETCGELHLWPHEIMEGGVQPCGSGLYVQEDPFWQAMERRVRPLEQPSPRLHHFREKHNAGRTLRLSRLSDLQDEPLDPETAAQVAQYGANNYAIYDAFLDLVAEETGRRPAWVVDASKDPYRLLWLLRSGLFNVKIFHLVKNPRGFVYSVTKDFIDGRRKDEPLHDAKRLYYAARQSLAWVVQNQLFATIAQNHVAPEDYMLIRYEDLASDPESVMRHVFAMINSDYRESVVEEFREGSPFAIAGNPMRYREGGIRLDEKWKRRLPASSRHVAEWVTSVNRNRFGYD